MTQTIEATTEISVNDDQLAAAALLKDATDENVEKVAIQDGDHTDGTEVTVH